MRSREARLLGEAGLLGGRIPPHSSLLTRPSPLFSEKIGKNGRAGEGQKDEIAGRAGLIHPVFPGLPAVPSDGTAWSTYNSTGR